MKAKEKRQLMATVISGLLASGDYSRLTDNGQPELGVIVRDDNWEENGFYSKVELAVVVDALEIVEHIDLAVDANSEDGKGERDAKLAELARKRPSDQMAIVLASLLDSKEDSLDLITFQHNCIIHGCMSRATFFRHRNRFMNEYKVIKARSEGRMFLKFDGISDEAFQALRADNLS